jgi:DNA helicase-2/ATP-dependent DNA helicase PcrA
MAAKAAVSALRGETEVPKPRNVYTGKTYNSADAVAEFFKMRQGGAATPEPPRQSAPASTPLDRLRAAASAEPKPRSNGIEPGKYVIHAKYGRGLVLRREGSGDTAKLTVSFPGFGQKKLVEKFANLQLDRT